jgi:hypothetical protein
LKHDDVCKAWPNNKNSPEFFFIITFSPFSSTPNNKNSPEFFCAFGSFNHSRVSSLAMVQPVSPILILIGLGFRSSSRQSIISAQPVILVLSTFVPTHYASSSFFHSSFHLVLLLRLSSTTVSLFVLGPLGCAVYPMLTVGLTCTQLSRPFSSWVCHVSDARGGCNVYPRLAFLFIQSVLLRPGQVQCFDLLRCRVFATFRAPSSFPVNRLPFVFVLVFVLVNVSTVSPLSFYYFITRSP